MRQTMIAQMERALNLLLPRFSDTFFVRAELVVRMGKTRQQSSIISNEQGFTLQQGKQRQELQAYSLIPLLAQEARQADSLELRLIRRNETVVVVANDQGTKVRLEKPLGNQTTDETEPLDIPETKELLQALNFVDHKGELRPGELRKYHQINQYLKAATPILKQLATLESEFTVIDAACGKSHLSFVLNFYLTQIMRCKVHVIGIDISPEVITAAQKINAVLGYRNAEYVCSSLAAYHYDRPFPVGLVVSLHACDTATDEAIALGVGLNAQAMIMTPCCQRELLEQLQLHEDARFMAPMLRHGYLKAKFADLLTDNIRCLALQANGYQVSVQEFCSPVDTPKNTMIRAAKYSSSDYRAHMETAYREYCALRRQFGITPRVLHPLFASAEQESGA
jgi:SAM-dependent methyltransferase